MQYDTPITVAEVATAKKLQYGGPLFFSEPEVVLSQP